MSQKAFIKLSRSMLKWQWFAVDGMLNVWIYLLLNARYEDGYVFGVLVKRGQVITGRKKMAVETGLSEQTIRTCLDRLKSTNEITTKATNKYTLITIIKWEEYQSKKIKTTSKITITSTNNQPTSNQQVTTNKEYKEYKEGKNKDIKSNTHFIPPTFDQVLEYALEKNQSKALAQKFFDYFTAGDWIDAKGKKVKNWKQKFITWISFNSSSVSEIKPFKSAEVKSNEDFIREVFGE